MAFEESIDPIVEKLQILIDDLRQDINIQKFEEILKKIDSEFPFVDLLEFLEMYVDGEYSKALIEKFHLVGHNDYYKILQILKLNKKRRAAIKNSLSRKTNLSDENFARRYEFLKKRLSRFHTTIKDKITYNVLTAVIILQLFSNGQNISNKEDIIKSLPNAVRDFEHLILAPHVQLSNIDEDKINDMVNSIVVDLKNSFFLEVDDSENFRLESHQLLISDYIYNIIQNKTNGITYQEIMSSLKEKLPILFKIPSALIDITLHELVTSNKVIKKEGYWKFKPFFDQYYTFENYRKLSSEWSYTRTKNREFFGRKITPDEFIKEIKELERGSFEDQDDQVTRIAGMILTNSNMMTLPPNDLDEFDFAVDLSRYEFTKQQQEIIKNLNLEISSKIVYVKVMINEKITISDVTDLILKLNERQRYEQGFLISFLPTDSLVEKILEKNKTLQIISEAHLREWCKITPIIPSRRGAVAVIRQGDNRGSIVKIKSVNYESGRADVILLPKMNETTSYIGALEEITIPARLNEFTDYSNIYFQFLSKLRQISKTDIFRKIVSDGLFVASWFNEIPKIRFVANEETECIFGTNFKTRIDFRKNLDWDSLTYSTDDLFSCTCFQWNENSRSKGLCEHLIFTLNESIKEIMASRNLSDKSIEQHLLQIEHRMDLFLKRLRYSSTDRSTMAKCPKCGQIAYSLAGVEDTFGYRQMSKDDKFSLRRQSRCKRCR